MVAGRVRARARYLRSVVRLLDDRYRTRRDAEADVALSLMTMNPKAVGPGLGQMRPGPFERLGGPSETDSGIPSAYAGELPRVYFVSC